MNKKSFTLIELLVVIAIIGILSSLVIARFSNWNDNARIANTLQWSAGVHRKMGANLVGHWPLNGDLKDMSGYGNNGLWRNQDSNAPSGNWINNGVNGEKALKFEGSPDRVIVHNPPALGSKWSISTWIYINSLPAVHNIFFASYDLPYLNIYNTPSFHLSWRDTVNVQQSITSLGVKMNEWIHIVGTHDGQTNAKLYVNGKVVAFNIVASSEYVPARSYWSIGSYHGMYYFNGMMNDVRAYDTALTAEEVSRIYAETKDQYLAYE